MSDEEMLQHYGVLGMRWGHRKDKKSGSSIRYKKLDREIDEAMYGKRGVKRIEKRMKKGNSHAVASAKETGRTVVQSLLITGFYADLTTNGALHKAAANSAKRYIKRYATEKAGQRANASLARIGQYTYKHIAGDVYQKVMS